jgi:putative transposase
MGSLCHLSNESIAERKDSYRITGKGLTYADQQNALPDKRKKDPALRMVHSQVCQDCLRRVDKAYQKFFDDIKRRKSGQRVTVGYPRFKKLDKYKSFTFPQVWMTVKNKKADTEQRLEIVKFRPVSPSKETGRVKFAHIILPGIGAIKIRLHRAVEWNNSKTLTVKRAPSGDWYVAVSVEIPLEPTLSDNGMKTGVDVGLKKQVATSEMAVTGSIQRF